MKAARSITIAVEGDSDEAVVRRLVTDHGFHLTATHGKRGVAYLNQKLAAFNSAARYGSWLVVRDLDHEASCAPAVVRARLPQPNDKMLFRIAHRSIEAWLLADAEGVQRHFKVAREHVPHEPEALHDPKAALVAMARKSSSRTIRDEMAPSEGTTARVGPGFVAGIIEFTRESWSWQRALPRSDSLRRCVRRLQDLGS